MCAALSIGREVKVNHKNIEPRIVVVVTVNPITFIYCYTQQDARREDSPLNMIV
jgi:hypothetical protein